MRPTRKCVNTWLIHRWLCAHYSPGLSWNASMYGTYKDVHSAPTSITYIQFLYLRMRSALAHGLALGQLEPVRQGRQMHQCSVSWGELSTRLNSHTLPCCHSWRAQDNRSNQREGAGQALGRHQVSFGWMMPNGSFLRLLALVHCTYRKSLTALCLQVWKAPRLLFDTA